MLQGYLFAVVAVLIWSGFILVSRFGGIGPLLPADVIAIRYFTCSVLLLPFWLFLYPFNLLNYRLIAAALIGGLGYALCAFQGFQTAPASHAAILLPGLLPLFISLISYFSKSESFTPIKWIGISLISVGIFCLFWYDILTEDGVKGGQLWFVGAALCWGTFSVLIKYWQISPWQATVSLAMVTACVYLPIYIFSMEKNISIQHWQHIALQGFYQGFLATIVQMMCYVQAVRRIGPATMGSMMALVPLIAGFSSIALYNELMSTPLLVCLVLVSGGVWAANLQRTPRQNSAAHS
ncbi:DMT family transporter [Ketobacter alkanivorans]|uniref:DMT family transporter n=1 Tax=Ketobacter alkanivorans TaxID=1917421 RepID=UPI001F2CA3EF|nr:DMT family transporter [Ketobacter alkanivorans]